MLTRRKAPLLGGGGGGAGVPGGGTAPLWTGYANNLAAIPNSTSGTTIVTGAVAHTMTAWTELIASTAGITQSLNIQISSTFATTVQTDALIDIGIGAAASEVVLIGGIPAGWVLGITAAGSSRSINLPFYLPAGTRISARAQSLQLTKNVAVAVRLAYGAGAFAFTGCDILGVNGAASQLTSVLPGSTGVMGSWTNIGAVTARAYGAVLPVVQGTMNANSSANTLHMQVGYGAVALNEYLFAINSNESSSGPSAVPHFAAIPAGTQLQLRGTASAVADAVDMGIVALY